MKWREAIFIVSLNVDTLHTQQIGESYLRFRKACPVQGSALPWVSNVDIHALFDCKVIDGGRLVALGCQVEDWASCTVHEVKIGFGILYQHFNYLDVAMESSKVQSGESFCVLTVSPNFQGVFIEGDKRFGILVEDSEAGLWILIRCERQESEILSVSQRKDTYLVVSVS